MNPIFNKHALNAMMDQLKARYLDTGVLPNLGVAITDTEETVFEAHAGFADLDLNIPISPQHHYRIYSMTKPITCLALMQLYERGLVNLNTPVKEYFPALGNLQVYRSGTGQSIETSPAASDITLHQLLTHSSGLTYGFNQSHPVEALYHDRHIDYVHRFPREAWIQELASMPLMFDPGTAWNYGVSTDVIGFVVEVITGKSLGEYFKDEIFDPIGMNETTFQYTGAPERMTSCYLTQNGKTSVHDAFDQSDFSKVWPSCSGGSGLISTHRDYLRFMKMLLAKGLFDGNQIIGRKTLELMHQNHLPNGLGMVEHSVGGFTENRHRGVGYGLGFSHRYDVAVSGVNGSIGEYGWGGMAGTNFWIDPKEQFGVLFTTQMLPSSAYDIRSDLRAMIYGALI